MLSPSVVKLITSDVVLHCHYSQVKRQHSQGVVVGHFRRVCAARNHSANESTRKKHLVERIIYIQQAANSARERDFIFHIAKTLEQVHNRNAKLGGLSERHLAHQSWPPIPKLVKGKVFPYSLPSVGPGADPSVQAVSPQVT